MKSFLMGLVGAFAVVALGCSSSSGGGGGGGLPASCTNNATININQACESCLESACPSAFSNFTSACNSYLSCVCGSSGAAVANCMPDQSCQSALSAGQQCESSNCSSQCNSSSSADGGTTGTPVDSGSSSSGGCSSLSPCCGMLPMAEQSGCMQLVGTGDSMACSEALTGYMNAGQCH